MNDLKPVLKALLAQANVNSHAISALLALAEKVRLDDRVDEFSVAMRLAMQGNRDFVAAISAAVEKLEDESNG